MRSLQEVVDVVINYLNLSVKRSIFNVMILKSNFNTP